MELAALKTDGQTPADMAATDQEGSTLSSPLSEMDDREDNEDGLDSIKMNGRGGYREGSDGSGVDPDVNDDASESDSALSEAVSDLNTDVNDTEAETERLFDTPQNRRQRDVLVDRSPGREVHKRTPSRPGHTSRAQERSSQHMRSVFLEGDEPVKLVQQRSSMEILEGAAEIDSHIDENVRDEWTNRKRKRSILTEDTSLREAVKKETSSGQAFRGRDNERTLMDNDASGHFDALHGQAHDAEDEAQSLATPEVESDTRFSRRTTRRNAALEDAQAVKPNVNSTKEQDILAAKNEEEAPEEETFEEADGEVDEEADIASKNAEEAERKNAAFRDWSNIEEMFSVFTHRLYNDRLRRLEQEEDSLLAEEPTHSEYLSMKKCIDERLNKKLQEINNERHFQIEALERRTVAQYAQIWSQFYQAVREKREQTLERLNQQWYEVQSARRSAHSLPDFGLLFPKQSSQRLRNAVAYNTEVSTLAGMAKYEGFPTGPELRGASPAELDSDFSAIESRRDRLVHMAHLPTRDPTPTAFSRLGPAGEQFIKGPLNS